MRIKDADKSFIQSNQLQLVIRSKKRDLADLIGQYGVEIIAIGNGTASREM